MTAKKLVCSRTAKIIFCILIISALFFCTYYLFNENNQMSNSNIRSIKFDRRCARLIEQLEETQRTGSFSKSGLTRDSEGNVVCVSLYGKMVTDENICLVSSITTLRTLVLGCCAGNTPPLTCKSFASLKASQSIKTLQLYGAVTLLSKEMCIVLAGLKLEVLRVDYSSCDSEGLDLLKERGTKLIVAGECRLPK